MSDAKEVLIVDDNEASVIFLAQILEDNGFKFRIARDGKEALAALEEKRPDLVLLDVMMPRKSGLNVFSYMKGEPDLAGIPVIFVTGVSEATGVNVKTGEVQPKETYGDDLARGVGSALRDALKEAAPDGLIEKPIEPRSLMEKVNKLLQ